MSITIKNIHNHIKYEEFDEEDGVGGFALLYEFLENKKVDKIMDDEYYYNLRRKKQNLMWVEKIKKTMKWVKGEVIYIRLKSVCEADFRCWFSRDRSKLFCVNMIVEKSGYVSRFCNNNYALIGETRDDTNDIRNHLYIRAVSYYNDKIADLILEEEKKSSATPVAPVIRVVPVIPDIHKWIPYKVSPTFSNPVAVVTPVASVASVSPVVATKTIMIKKKKIKLVVKDSFVTDVVNK